MEHITPEQIIAFAPLQMSPLDEVVFRGIHEPLERNPIIFHFIKDVTYFISLLQTSSLSLCRCDRFKDVSDGLLPEVNRTTESETMTRQYEHFERTAMIDGKRVKFIRDPAEEFESQELARMTTYVHCWFSGNEPTPEMWQEYGNDSKGVCIQTNVRDLWNAIPRQPPFGELLIGKVSYSNCKQAIGTFYSFLPLFHKPDRYQHEQEVRLAALVEPDKKTGEYPVDRERIPLHLDVRNMIHKIIVGHNMPIEIEQEIIVEVQSRLGNTSVVRALN